MGDNTANEIQLQVWTVFPWLSTISAGRSRMALSLRSQLSLF